METKVYLYDANGSDKEIKWEDIDLQSINDNQILWINVFKRDETIVRQITDKLQIKNVPLKSLLKVNERPKLDKFEEFYRLFIVSVDAGEDERLRSIPIDFLIGKNFVITIHDGEVEYFKEFRKREKGETNIGELDADSFVASLLDLHIVTYFRAVELIEKEVDELDDQILCKEVNYQKFLSQMVKLRGNVSKLRRWLVPHRDVFYPLTRPDFFPVGDTDSIEHFKLVSEHFENAVDSIESSRETVLSLFDFYATKSSQEMNELVQKLTFVTVLLGSLGVAAGILGMNFKLDFFDSENGFWHTLLGMGGFFLLTIVTARWRKWI